MNSQFNNVKALLPDAIFHTNSRFLEDNDPCKINLGIGAYRTEEGKPYVLKIVREVEEEILNDKTLNKEYLPIGGDSEFIKASQENVLGKCRALQEGRVAGVQTLSGTGALCICANFIKNNFPDALIFKSTPTWGNHKNIFNMAGLKQFDYRYWDPKTKNLNFSGMLEDLRKAPNSSVILLHACAHNPTGVDPTQSQWRQLCNLFKEKSFIALFDSAYQGYATGDLKRDSYPVRLFEEEGLEFLIAQSYSKNLGLYGERVGCASIVCRTSRGKKACDTQLRAIIRPMYSNPPKHGCYIAKRVLLNPEKFNKWKKELSYMSGRILKMRRALRDSLEKLGTPGKWNHLTDQIGMFTYSGLSSKQVDFLEKKYHIYLLKSGRISMAGVSMRTLKYLANAIDNAVRTVD